MDHDKKVWLGYLKTGIKWGYFLRPNSVVKHVQIRKFSNCAGTFGPLQEVMKFRIFIYYSYVNLFINSDNSDVYVKRYAVLFNSNN